MPTFQEPLVGRGAAFGDYDGDNRMDVLVVDLEGPARLLRNVFRRAGKGVRLRLRGKAPNTEALGAVVTVRNGRSERTRLLKRGGSVLSSHDSCLVLGLASDDRAEVRVRWPTGETTVGQVEAPADGEVVLGL